MRILNNMLVSISKQDVVNGVLTILNGVEIIANGCLRDNKYVEIVNCPSTLKKIGNNAFQNSSLEMINFNEGLIEIGDCAFYDTKIRMSYLPDSLEYLGDSAFEDCNLLQEVKFGHHLKNIPKCCFRGTSISCIKLEEGIESIGDGAFEYLKKLRKIDFCSSLKKIGDNAFSNNSRTLVELNFNEGLIEIGNNAFSNGYVENLYLPDSLKYIGDDVPMEKLKKVSCANIEVLDLFFKSQSIKYLGKDKKQKVVDVSFSLNIKSLSELSNGMYGEYFFEGGNGYFRITSYINNKDKPRQSKIKNVYDNLEYADWSYPLKRKELKIKKLNVQKAYLQSIVKNIEDFLATFGERASEFFTSDMQETNPIDGIQTTNDEMKALTDELFSSSKKEVNMNDISLNEESNLQTSHANDMIIGVPLNENYDYIDDNNRMWRNGDMLTFNEQQQIEQKGISLINKRKQK
ncbi:MAG: leucine-rich repeat protein [Bacilli bacterium]|nr:leucine-rich repeat protein [Bacilli bacterium]